MGSAPRQSLCDRITRQQKWVTRLHAGGGSGSQELGVGPAGCERTGPIMPEMVDYRRRPLDSHKLLKLG